MRRLVRRGGSVTHGRSPAGASDPDVDVVAEAHSRRRAIEVASDDRGLLSSTCSFSAAN